MTNLIVSRGERGELMVNVPLVVGQWYISLTRHHGYPGDLFCIVSFDNDTVYARQYNVQHGNEYSHHSRISTENFKSRFALSDFSPDEIELYFQYGTDEFEKLSKQPVTASNETALTVAGSSDQIESIQHEIALKYNHANTVQSILSGRLRRMTALMDDKRRALDRQMTIMKGNFDLMNEALTMYGFIHGIGSEIICLRNGEPADETTPIHVLQSVLFMDEEVASVAVLNGTYGITYHSIDVFDEWVVSSVNALELLLPYERCVVAMRTSRQDRRYWHIVTNWANMGKDTVYFLVRNGEQVYRVCADFPFVKSRLFPTVDEWDKTVSMTHDAAEHGDEVGVIEAQKGEVPYRKVVAWLQGLITRSPVFHPCNPDINLYKPDSIANGEVVLVRNKETLGLSPGHAIPYAEWQKRGIDQIVEGSRILVGNNNGLRSMRDYELRDRYSRQYQWQYPSPPDSGVYTVEEVDERGWMRIMYFPASFMERRTRFWLKPDDWFILNYDDLTMNEIATHIGARHERFNYLQMLPTLYKAHEQLSEEQESESQFTELLVNDGHDYEMVQDAIRWWKMKVKRKRPITSDDNKAWRMINRHISKK